MQIRGVLVSCLTCHVRWTALVVEAIARCPQCGDPETEILEIIPVVDRDRPRRSPLREQRENPRGNPPRGARKLHTPIQAPRRRRNSPRGVPVKAFDRRSGHLVSRRVLELAYYNVGSAGRDPYVHEFESDGVELWALVDGSILLRHLKHRLWEDFVVSDGE